QPPQAAARPPLAAGGDERRHGDAQRHAFEAARAGGAEVEGAQPPPAPDQHGLELVGLDAGHDAVFQRGALPGQVVARARVLDEVVQQLAHATRIPPGGARGPARGVHWDRMLRARLGAVLAVLALVAGVAGAAIVLLAGPGSRMGWWTWRTGLG